MKRFKEWLSDLLMGWINFICEDVMNPCIDYDAWEDVEEAPPLMRGLSLVFYTAAWVDRLLTRVWHWSYEGSDDELELALDGCIPEDAWGDALRARVEAHRAEEEAERKRWALSTWLAPEIRKEAA